VHELLKPEDQITPCDTAPLDSSARMNFAEMNVMHYSELRGSDVRASSDGLWREITYGKGRMSTIKVDAGPILHRGNKLWFNNKLSRTYGGAILDPCIGYVFTESQHPARKLVILGDTYDPSAIEPLCFSPSPSLLIHEATDSHISQHADPSGKLSRRTPAAVRERALSKGHSVPEMAGAFAKRIGANALVLNHIGGRSVVFSFASCPTKRFSFSKPFLTHETKKGFLHPDIREILLDRRSLVTLKETRIASGLPASDVKLLMISCEWRYRLF
jgi:ribonuclease Z